MIKPRYTLSFIALGLFAAVGMSEVAHAGEQRVLQDSTPAAGIEKVSLESGVGEVRIEAGDTDAIEVRVEIKPGDKSWFGSKPDLEAVTLDMKRDGKELQLGVDGEHIQEHWVVRVPARMALELDHGVGEVHVTGLEGDVEAEVGVGELRIEGGKGKIDRAEVHVGVGDAAIKGVGGPEQDGFPLGRTVSWTGEGEQSIDAEVGVGEATVSLR